MKFTSTMYKKLEFYNIELDFYNNERLKYVFGPLTLEKIMFWSLNFEKCVFGPLILDKIIFLVF